MIGGLTLKLRRKVGKSGMKIQRKEIGTVIVRFHSGGTGLLLADKRFAPFATERLRLGEQGEVLPPRMAVRFDARHVLQVLLGGDGVLPNTREHGCARNRNEETEH